MQKIIGEIPVQTKDEYKEAQREMANLRLKATQTIIDRGIMKPPTNKDVTKRGVSNINFGSTQGVADISLLNDVAPDLNGLYYKIANIITKDKYNSNNFSTLYKMFEGMENIIRERLKQNPSLKEDILNNFEEFKNLIDGKYTNYTFIDSKLESIKKVIDETQYIKSLEQKENDVVKDFIMKSNVDAKSNYARSNLDINSYLDDIQDIDEETKNIIKEQVIAKHNEKNAKEMPDEEVKKHKDTVANQHDNSYTYYVKNTKPLISRLVNDKTTVQEFMAIVPSFNFQTDAKSTRAPLNRYYIDLNTIRNQIEYQMKDLDKAKEFLDILEEKAIEAKDAKKENPSASEKKEYTELMRKLELCRGKIMVILEQKRELERYNGDYDYSYNNDSPNTLAPKERKDLELTVETLTKGLENVIIPKPTNNSENTILNAAVAVANGNLKSVRFDKVQDALNDLLSTAESNIPRVLYYNPKHKFFRQTDIEILETIFKNNKKFNDLANNVKIAALLNAIQSIQHGEDINDINTTLKDDYNIIVEKNDNISSFSINKNSEEVQKEDGSSLSVIMYTILGTVFSNIMNFLSGNGSLNEVTSTTLPFYNRRPTSPNDIMLYTIQRVFNIVDHFIGITPQPQQNPMEIIIYILLALVILYIMYLYQMVNSGNNGLPELMYVQPRIADITDAQAVAMITNGRGRGKSKNNTRGRGIIGGQSILSKLRLTNESSFPRNSQNFLDKYGNQNVVKMVISRALVSEAAQKVYTGKVIDNETKIPYDEIYHLKLILHLEDGVVARVEKIPQVAINYNIEKYDGELVEVPMNGEVFTLNELVDTTIKNMGINDFFRYHAFSYNCQNLVLNFINSAGLLTPEIEEFVMQYADEEAFKRDHRLRYEFGSTVTDLGNIISRITGGSEYY